MTPPLRDQLQSALGTAYTLERELGGGGMSRVFVAREEALDRDVVVKVLAPEQAAGISADRFAREIRLAAALQEPHIVPVLSAGTTSDGLPYYTMPYVRGESLRARLAQGPLPLGERVSVLRDVAEALAYAHAQGVVHRDIKPENVLLSSRTAVVTDFGIAKALQRSRTVAPEEPSPAATTGITQVGMSLGTPAYMAPEQAAGDPAVDHRADLYAWGVMAYELLAGRHPFAGKTTPQALIAAHFSETPAALPGAVPRPLAALVMRCLAKDPAQRPASANELLVALDAAPSGPATPRRRVALVAATVIALAAGSVFAWRTRRPAASDRAADETLRLAVLPFEHQGPADQAIFADGLTDAVIAKLGALPTLAVIDRHSAAQYRATTKSVKQIGRELEVRYLLEGVVRWAKDASGVWRAQVTPTLVDARTGTTTWTGPSQVITPTDPFTAQGEIATDVARALEVQLRPADAAALLRRTTNNPEAFAAYTRGRQIMTSGEALTVASLTRALAEFEHAIALDSAYADAWADRANAAYSLATWATDDRLVTARMRRTVAEGLSRAPDHPMLLALLAHVQLHFDQDTTGVDALIRRVAARGDNDVRALLAAGRLSSMRGRYDTSYALIRRAVALDPRSAFARGFAAETALLLRRWSDARRDTDVMLALDSASEWAWMLRLRGGYSRGDTIAMQADAAPALRLVTRPSPDLLDISSAAGGPYAARFATLSLRTLGAASLSDTVGAYYETKASLRRRNGDRVGARVYFDSIRTVLAGRSFEASQDGGIDFLILRTLAQAELDDTAAARRGLAEVLAITRRTAVRQDLLDVLEPTRIAAIYARLGEPETAVHWLEAGLAAPSGWTARGYDIRPRLFVLRGTPAYERFRKAHPE